MEAKRGDSRGDENALVRRRGFTLIELLVTLAVASIFLTVAVPTFLLVVEDNRLTAQANDFVTDAYRARGEAVSRGRRVTMCRCVSDSAGKCEDSSADSSGDYSCDRSGSTNWDQGWIVFVDVDEDAEHDGATEEIIRFHDRLPSGLDLSGDDAVDDYISYDRRGIASATTGDPQAGTLTLASSKESVDGKILERTIVVSATGAVESCNPNYTSCP